tara:strand:+ start:4389 stop:5396 length:1008 start_codon:yes stop_codon:yes gene_type:complete
MLVNLNNQYTTRKQTIVDLGGWDEDFTFGTTKVPMYYKRSNEDHSYYSGNEVLNKKILLNNQTGQQLAVVGDKYTNDYSHMQQFQAVEDKIVASDLDLSGMKREISVSHEGARAYARYSFPAHEITVGNTGPVALDILCRNSFDGSWPTIFEGGAERWACLNKCVFGSVFAVSKQRHTKNINYEKGALQVMNCLETFLSESDKWNSWINTPVTDEQAWQVIAQLSKNTYALNSVDSINNGTSSILETLEEATQNKDGSSRVNSSLATLWNLWKSEYKPSLGSNLWSLYNVMTDWSTKGQEVTRKNTGNTVTSLQTQASERIRKIIQTDNTFRLAA